MSWNYRVLRNEHDELDIIECYYEHGEIVGYTEEVFVTGDSLDELREVMGNMSEALEQPILTLADVEGRSR